MSQAKQAAQKPRNAHWVRPENIRLAVLGGEQLKLHAGRFCLRGRPRPRDARYAQQQPDAYSLCAAGGRAA